LEGPSENPPKRPRIEATPEPETPFARSPYAQSTQAAQRMPDSFPLTRIVCTQDSPFSGFQEAEIQDPSLDDLFCKERLQDGQNNTPDKEESEQTLLSDLVKEVTYYACEIKQAQLEEIALENKEAELMEAIRKIRTECLVVKRRREDDEKELKRLLKRQRFN
jgi:hypothetical protein